MCHKEVSTTAEEEAIQVASHTKVMLPSLKTLVSSAIYLLAMEVKVMWSVLSFVYNAIVGIIWRYVNKFNWTELDDASVFL